MLRIIKVKGRTGRYNTSFFPYIENEMLTIRFEFVESRYGVYIATIQCGNQKQCVKLDKNKEIQITPDFIKKGGFEPIYIYLGFWNAVCDKQIINDNPSKGGFFIEPLLIIKCGENTTGEAWMSKMENLVSSLASEVSEMKKRLAEYDDNGVPIITV